MNIQPDFEELLQLLEENNIDYMIVGGYAVAFHGYPRFTNDLDVFYNLTDENISKLQNILLKFGFNTEDIPINIFKERGAVLTFGVEPVRIALLNDIDGINFEQAKQNVVRGRYGKTEINFIGLNELIKNKTSTTRLKDKADIEELKK